MSKPQKIGFSCKCPPGGAERWVEKVLLPEIGQWGSASQEILSEKRPKKDKSPRQAEGQSDESYKNEVNAWIRRHDAYLKEKATIYTHLWSALPEKTQMTIQVFNNKKYKKNLSTYNIRGLYKSIIAVDDRINNTNKNQHLLKLLGMIHLPGEDIVQFLNEYEQQARTVAKSDKTWTSKKIAHQLTKALGSESTYKDCILKAYTRSVNAVNYPTFDRCKAKVLKYHFEHIENVEAVEKSNKVNALNTSTSKLHRRPSPEMRRMRSKPHGRFDRPKNSNNGRSFGPRGPPRSPPTKSIGRDKPTSPKRSTMMDQDDEAPRIGTNSRFSGTCHNCGKVGHKAADCRSQSKSAVAGQKRKLPAQATASNAKKAWHGKTNAVLGNITNTFCASLRGTMGQDPLQTVMGYESDSSSNSEFLSDKDTSDDEKNGGSSSSGTSDSSEDSATSSKSSSTQKQKKKKRRKESSTNVNRVAAERVNEEVQVPDVLPLAEDLPSDDDDNEEIDTPNCYWLAASDANSTFKRYTLEGVHYYFAEDEEVDDTIWEKDGDPYGYVRQTRLFPNKGGGKKEFIFFIGRSSAKLRKDDPRRIHVQSSDRWMENSAGFTLEEEKEQVQKREHLLNHLKKILEEQSSGNQEEAAAEDRTQVNSLLAKFGVSSSSSSAISSSAVSSSAIPAASSVPAAPAEGGISSGKRPRVKTRNASEDVIRMDNLEQRVTKLEDRLPEYTVERGIVELQRAMLRAQMIDPVTYEEMILNEAHVIRTMRERREDAELAMEVEEEEEEEKEREDEEREREIIDLANSSSSSSTSSSGSSTSSTSDSSSEDGSSSDDEPELLTGRQRSTSEEGTVQEPNRGTHNTSKNKPQSKTAGSRDHRIRTNMTMLDFQDALVQQSAADHLKIDRLERDLKCLEDAEERLSTSRLERDLLTIEIENLKHSLNSAILERDIAHDVARDLKEVKSSNEALWENMMGVPKPKVWQECEAYRDPLIREYYSDHRNLQILDDCRIEVQEILSDEYWIHIDSMEHEASKGITFSRINVYHLTVSLGIMLYEFKYSHVLERRRYWRHESASEWCAMIWDRMTYQMLQEDQNTRDDYCRDVIPSELAGRIILDIVQSYVNHLPQELDSTKLPLDIYKQGIDVKLQRKKEQILNHLLQLRGSIRAQNNVEDQEERMLGMTAILSECYATVNAEFIAINTSIETTMVPVNQLDDIIRISSTGLLQKLCTMVHYECDRTFSKKLPTITSLRRYKSAIEEAITQPLYRMETSAKVPYVEKVWNTLGMCSSMNRFQKTAYKSTVTTILSEYSYYAAATVPSGPTGFKLWFTNGLEGNITNDRQYTNQELVADLMRGWTDAPDTSARLRFVSLTNPPTQRTGKASCTSVLRVRKTIQRAKLATKLGPTGLNPQLLAHMKATAAIPEEQIEILAQALDNRIRFNPFDGTHEYTENDLWLQQFNKHRAIDLLMEQNMRTISSVIINTYPAPKVIQVFADGSQKRPTSLGKMSNNSTLYQAPNFQCFSTLPGMQRERDIESNGEEDEDYEDESDDMSHAQVNMIRTGIKAHDHHRMLDSGTNIHVHTSVHGIEAQAVPNHDNTAKMSTVSGQELPVTHIANIKHYGKIMVSHEAELSLVSIPQLVLEGYTVTFGKDRATITNSYGDAIECEFRENKHFYVSDKQMNKLVRLTTKKSAHNVAAQVSGEVSNTTKDSARDEHGSEVTAPEADKRAVLTKEMRARADQVRILHNYCHPSDKSLKLALSNGTIIGTPLTDKDVDNHRTLFGPCLACIMGKKPNPSYQVTSIAPPADIVGGCLHADPITIESANSKCKIRLLASIDEFSDFIIVTPLKSKNLRDINIAFFDLISIYRSYGHRVKRVVTDSESILIAAEAYLGHNGVEMLHTPPHQHAQRIERHIRTLKDRVRTILAGMTHKLPIHLYGDLYDAACKYLNDMPTSKHPSQTPNMLVTHRKLDLGRWPQLVPFGTIAMLHNNGPQAPGQPRSHLGVVLGPCRTTYGAYNCYKLHTKQKMRRKAFTVLKDIPELFPWQPNTTYTTSSSTTTVPIPVDNTALTDPPQPESEASEPEPSAATIVEDESDIMQPPPGYYASEPESLTGSEFEEETPEPDTYDTADDVSEPPTAPVVEPTVDKQVRFSLNPESSREGVNAKRTVEGTRKYTAVRNNSGSKMRGRVVQINTSGMKRKIMREEGNPMRDRVAEERMSPTRRRDAEENVSPSLEPRVAEERMSPTRRRDAEENVSPSLEPRMAEERKSPIRRRDAEENVSPSLVTANKRRRGNTPPSEAEVNMSPSPNNRTNPYGLRKRDPLQKRKRWDDGPYAMGAMFAQVYRVSVKQALVGEHKQESLEAIIDEVQNMLQYKVGHYVKFKDIPYEKRKNIIISFMFLKHKTNADGKYTRTKARLVGNGAHQKNHMYDLVSSATVALASVFILLNIATYFKAYICSFDIKGAFLNAPFTEDDEVTYIRINKEITDIWITIEPTAIPFVDERGELLLQLDKFIYGLKQAPLKFQEHLLKTLLHLGYRQLETDECLFIKYGEGDHFSILSTHVDDILQITTKLESYEELKQGLITQYGEVTASSNATEYLGMGIDRSQCGTYVKMSQLGLLEKIVKDFPTGEGGGRANTPAANDLFLNTGNNSSPKVDSKKYLKLIMTLMYLARLTRPDILLPVTYLATKSHMATTMDMNKCYRIVNYLNNTKNVGIIIHCTVLEVYLWCDASFNTHVDGKGHTGFYVGFGKSYVHGRSGKQKLATTSSTEAECVGASEGAKMAYWVREVLREMCITALAPITFYQDNTSAISLASELTKTKKSRHLIPKLAYIKDLIQRGIILPLYLMTGKMTADLMTKPLQGGTFYEHRDNLTGMVWQHKFDHP